MARHPYIAIEGVIGVGKTTLARLLKPELGGELLLEEFEENPFLSDFYADRARYAFQTQIFFLLSRYRQQVDAIPQALQRGPLISDYTFAKDSLFAHLNLSGHELAVYQQLYAALNKNIPRPSLVVYLRADLDVLMARIAARDRPYERNMDPDYIEQLRLAYEQFMAEYQEAPVLPIDTNNLDIVQNPDDRAYVIQRIKSALEYGIYQAPLPGVEAAVAERQPQAILEELEAGPHPLSHFQRFHLSLDADKGFDPDPYFNFIALNEELGELARALKRAWIKQTQLRQEGCSAEEARQQALAQFRSLIEDELADCLAYLLKLSNYVGVDLEKAYLEKMALNARRHWRDGEVVDEKGEA